VAERSKGFEVTPGSTAEIQDPERRLTLDVLQQGRDVLCDVVVPRATPKVFRIPIVVIEGTARDLLKLLRAQFHAWPEIEKPGANVCLPRAQ
jgi:hypothetical protein